MKKLIVVDLDGTLLNSKGECSKKSADYLFQLKEKGHIIVIATGRRLCSALDVTNNAYFANYVICDCGSGIYNVDNKEFIYKSVVSKELIKKTYDLTKNYFSKFLLCTSNNLYVIDNNLSVEKVYDIIYNVSDVFHITINIKDFIDIYEVKSILNNEISELNFLVMQNSFAENKWFDVFNINNSKYNSIKNISTIENISNDDIICFGDGLNDIDMLKKCGIGVAMGNALSEVKEAADFVTDSHDKDGIMSFLKNNI